MTVLNYVLTINGIKVTNNISKEAATAAQKQLEEQAAALDVFTQPYLLVFRPDWDSKDPWAIIPTSAILW